MIQTTLFCAFRYFDVVQYASLSFPQKNGTESGFKELTKENLQDLGLANEVFSSSPCKVLVPPLSNSSHQPMLLTPRPSTNSSESDCLGTVRTEMTGLTAKYHIDGKDGILRYVSELSHSYRS